MQIIKQKELKKLLQSIKQIDASITENIICLLKLMFYMDFPVLSSLIFRVYDRNNVSPTNMHKAMMKNSKSLFREELCTCWRAWRRCSVALCVARCAVLRLVSMTLSCSPCYPTISLMCWKMSWMSRTFYAISLVSRCRYAISSSYKSLSKIIFCVSSCRCGCCYC